MGFFKKILILLGLKQKQENKILRTEDLLIPQWKEAYEHFFSLKLPENDYPDRKTLLKQKKIFEGLVLSNVTAVEKLSPPQTFYTLPDDWMKRISPKDRYFMRIYMTLHLWFFRKLKACWLHTSKILDELNVEVEKLGKDIPNIVDNFQEDSSRELKQKETELNRDLENCIRGVSLLENNHEQYHDKLNRINTLKKELLPKQSGLNTLDQNLHELNSNLFELINQINMKRGRLLSRIFGWLFRSGSSPAREEYYLLLQERRRIKQLMRDKIRCRLLLKGQISNRRIQIQILENDLVNKIKKDIRLFSQVKKDIHLLSGKITPENEKRIKNSVICLSKEKLPYHIRTTIPAGSSQFNIIKKHFPINDKNKGIGKKKFDDIRRHFENNAVSHA